MAGEDQYFDHYKPSIAAAIIFVVLFSASTLSHTWQVWRRRTWYWIPFTIGGYCKLFLSSPALDFLHARLTSATVQIVGYACRTISSTQYPDSTLVPYILQSLLILLAPALYAASIYMVLGRIIRVTAGEKYALIRVTWLTKIFVTGDVLSFLVQCMGKNTLTSHLPQAITLMKGATGGAILASADTQDQRDRGELLITIGLIIQVIFFGLFILVSIHYNWRLRKEPTDASRATPVSWQFYLYILYATNGLIMVRSVFRLIEYVQGEDGALLSKEVYLYVFDAALMIITMAIFNWKHPSILIPAKVKGQAQDVEAGSDNFLMQQRSK